MEGDLFVVDTDELDVLAELREAAPNTDVVDEVVQKGLEQ